MEWQTKIQIDPPPWLFSYATRFALFGSCFAQEMALRMEQLDFYVLPNPFGVLFNPESVARALLRLAHPRPFTRQEVIETPNGFCSFSHHTSFTKPTPEAFLEHANRCALEAVKQWEACEVVVVSFGTAVTFRHKGTCVANCHKWPAAQFERTQLTPPEIIDLWAPLLSSTDKKWVFTVSPIRHLAQGAHGNQLSKASLLLAVAELCRQFPQAYYFPSYEILLDELRDYRFYAQDRCHPSQEAQSYIWSRFLETCFQSDTQQAAAKVARFKAAQAHRPLFPQSESYRLFVQNTEAQSKEIEQLLGLLKKNL